MSKSQTVSRNMLAFWGSTQLFPAHFSLTYNTHSLHVCEGEIDGVFDKWREGGMEGEDGEEEFADSLWAAAKP